MLNKTLLVAFCLFMVAMTAVSGCSTEADCVDINGGYCCPGIVQNICCNNGCNDAGCLKKLAAINGGDGI